MKDMNLDGDIMKALTCKFCGKREFRIYVPDNFVSVDEIEEIRCINCGREIDE